jgi:hypothetical protein
VKIPLYAISVGGDAQSTFGKLTRAQQRLLPEADFITFRNPEDEKLAEEAGIAHFAIYPDMVWTAGRTPSASMGTGTICIEFSGTRHKAFYYIAFAATRALTGRDIVDVGLHQPSALRAAGPGFRLDHLSHSSREQGANTVRAPGPRRLHH